MTKNDLADKIAERTGLAASQAREALEAAIDAVADELAAGGEVALAGFGKFSVSDRAPRQGRNPATGNSRTVSPAHAAAASAAARAADARTGSPHGVAHGAAGQARIARRRGV